MIGQITPLVQAARRVWITAVVGHIVGATLSASLLGFVLGACGLIFRANQWALPLDVLGGSVLLLCALRDGDIWPWPLLTLHRQTPAWFLGVFGPLWGAFAWGADLGQGWTTNIVFTGYYGLLLWAIASGSPTLGAVLLGAFGLGRALPVLVVGLVRRDNELNAIAPLHLVRPVNAVALAVVAGYFLAAW